MAIEIVNNQDTIDNFKTKVNRLSNLIGDLSQLDTKDSNVMDAINRIDLTAATTVLVDRMNADSAALVAYRVLQDSATAADTLASVAGDSANLALINANIATLAKRDSAGYIKDLNFTHAMLSSVVANQHIDWTTDQGGTNIHTGNYTNSQSTYASIHSGLTGASLSTQSGATVVSSITVNTKGHLVTTPGTRELTPANIGALASNGTADQANGLKDENSDYRTADYLSTANTIVRRNADEYIRVNGVILDAAYSQAVTTPTSFVTLNASGDARHLKETTVANAKTTLAADGFDVPAGETLGVGSSGWMQTNNTNNAWLRSQGSAPVYVDVNISSGTRDWQGADAVGIATNGDIAAGWSDMRLKTKVGELDNALEKVCSLSGFLYQSSDLALEYDLPPKDVIKVGLSAQEVQKVLPQVVSGAPMNIDHGTDFLNVDYAKMVPLLIEAIKELKDQVDRIKA